MSTLVCFPPPEQGLHLHTRMLGGDPTAPADVCATYCDPLSAWMEAAFPHDDPHLCREAAGRALFDYVQHPHCFNPQRLDLAAYLRMAARRDLLNLRRGEARHHIRRSPWQVVEEGEEAGNYLQGDPPDLRLVREEEGAWASDVVRRVRQECSPQEECVLDLMLAGERRTEVFAAAMGLEDLPKPERERQVYRMKERLRKRLQRVGERHA